MITQNKKKNKLRVFPSFSLFLHPFSPFSLNPKLTTTGGGPIFFPATANETTISHPSVLDLGYLCPTNAVTVVVSVNLFTSTAPSFVLLSPHHHIVPVPLTGMKRRRKSGRSDTAVVGIVVVN